MKKTIRNAIILTEAIVLAGLAALILFIGFQDRDDLFGRAPSSASVDILSAAPELDDELPELNEVIVNVDPTKGPVSLTIEDSPAQGLEPAILPNSEESVPTQTAYECGPPDGWVFYQVVEGDTLADLSERTGAAITDLQKANCLGDLTLVVPGMGIFLPRLPEIPATAAPEPTGEPALNGALPVSVEPVITPTAPEPPSETPGTLVAGRTTGGWVEIFPGRVNGYVVRPGTGWQYYFSSPRVNTIPQTVAYGERDAMSWNILNPAEGVYNWAAIDNQMAIAVGRGEQFSFRVYTSAGTHKVPQWAINAGVKILPNGSIDYNNCIYQEKWGKFVNALVNRYDGNPDIAFIDISGYSDYNEWAWEDQTEWDYVWANQYEAGNASASTMSTMDSYTRRRLADIFIGGSFQGHQCKTSNGGTQTVNYSYGGFHQSQLVLPYAGIRQSTQYVFLRRTDVGFRHDGWGSENSNGIYESLWKELSTIWRNAPVVLETALPGQFVYSHAKSQIIELHGSLVHNPKILFTDAQIVDLVGSAGYRYALLGATYESQVAAGDRLDVEMGWRNIGTTPAYPKMGQTFTMYLYLTDLNNTIVKTYKVAANVASWMPNHGSKDIVRGAETSGSMLVPPDLPPGQYKLKVAIIYDWSGEPIGLDAALNVVNGLYELGRVTVTVP